MTTGTGERSLPADLPEGLERRSIELVVPIGGTTTGPTVSVATELVEVAALPLASAIEHFAALTIADVASDSIRAWSIAIRAALDLLARGRLLPSASPAGWDAWRLDPLDVDDHALVESLAAAFPAEAIARPITDLPPRRLDDPATVIRQLYDAVADRMVRTAAAPIIAESPVFADTDPTRIPHLESWVADVAGVHCAGAGLALRVYPPGTFHDPDRELAALTSGDPIGGDSDLGPAWRVVFQLRSLQDPSLVVDAGHVWATPVEVMERFGPQAETDLLAGLQRAVAVCPVLAPALDRSAPTHIDLDDAGLDQLLDQLDALANASIEVRWPSELVAPDFERRLVVSASAPGSALPTVTDLDSLLSVNWEFLLEGTPLTTHELEILGEAKRAIVPLRGRWVRLARRDRERLKARVPKLTAADALAAALGAGLSPDLDASGEGTSRQLAGGLDEAIDVEIRGAVAELADRLRSLNGQREEPEPERLAAELRPYQRRGLAWMADVCDIGLGGCLADDMGLGKTIQVLALHAHRLEQRATQHDTGSVGPTLVVCPTSLLANWEREAHRFLPGIIVHRYHGSNRSLATVETGDIVVTSYGVVRSDTEALAAVGWDLVVADEAQHAKNPRSRTAKALRGVPSRSRLALTGTPVENRLSELWSILDWAVPGLLGPLETFRRTLATPIEKDGSPSAAARLGQIVGPFLLRRKKTDPGIAPELPAKTERDVIVPLTEEQVSLYKATTEEALADLKENDGLVRHGLILRLLTALKQITNHPAQFLGEAGPIAGRSGKLEALDEIVDLAMSVGEQTLVFSQYVTMGRLLAEHLGARGISTEVLHGGLPVARRQDLVDRFQAGEFPVLILSLKAGGTGLNLTAASQVIHYDRWWNPAVEDQATDRAHRIGQQRSVAVHRLVTEGTVEDRVAELLAGKRELADRVIGGSESWIGSLSDDELAAMVNFTLDDVDPDEESL